MIRGEEMNRDEKGRRKVIEEENEEEKENYSNGQG
jgi:hypothetical protein